MPTLFALLVLLALPTTLMAQAASPAVASGGASSAASVPTRASSAPLTPAADVGMRRSGLARAEWTVMAGVAQGAFPGAALAVGRGERIITQQGFGRLAWDQQAVVNPDRTVYDLASLTKVVAATTAAMLLWEDGLLDLDAPVSDYLPEFRGPQRDRGSRRITVRQILTHSAGFPAGANISAPNTIEARARALGTPLIALPGERVTYTDIGFVVLWQLAERVAGESLFGLLDRRVYGPLGMRSTTFLPGEPCARCAPTGVTAGGNEIRGRVHDPTARRLGGVTGNAGLFSTLADLSRFAAMLANEGTLDGVQIFRRETVARFTERQEGVETRALGWDTSSRESSRGAAGALMSERAFGHTGFTGTSLWVDPETGVWTVLLSNRTYEPRVRSPMQEVRREVHDWVARSVGADA